MKEKVLIANRGEIALRIMGACEELGIDYVAVYTKEDQASLHVKKAKEKYRISDYRDMNDLLAVADESGCTAIHPGYGFLAEDFRFARRVVMRERPLTFIGPSWEAIRDLGNKLFMKRVAKDLGIPVIPGTTEPIYNEIEAELKVEELLEELTELGFENPTLLVKAVAGGGGMGIGNKLFMKRVAKDLGIPVIPGTTEPIYNEIEAELKVEELLEELTELGFENPTLLVKAVAGGGGMGIEEVRDLEEFRPVFRRIRAYAKRLFGDEGIIIEGKIPEFQHLEVQLLGSKKGEYVHFGTRNCTIQSPFRQKRIELAPGFDYEREYQFNPKEVEAQIIKHSLKLAKYFNYDSVGTWEWLVTPEGKFYLMEVNTRIQVENEVSAKISLIKGNPVNLIKEQIRVAFGEKLGYKQEDIEFRGTSIEFRLIAEDTQRGFKPLSGTIEKFSWTPQPWLTVRTHVPQDEPYTIPTQFDPNLALAIVYGENLEEALKRGKEFLEDLVIEGKTPQGEPLITNVEFLKNSLERVYQFLPS